ncbi:tetratricopeptide repeat protein [Collimonas arenae]|nr:tetratricopeptide repeat protein [Collimonas arenae]
MLVEAEAGYRQILSSDVAHADANHLLGIIALQKGNLTEAEMLIRKALACREEAAFIGNLGSLLFEAGRQAEAESAFRRALELAPNFIEAHNNLGNLLNQAGRFNEAEDSLRRALALNPDYMEAIYNLGNFFHATARIAEAEAAFRRVLELQPDFAKAHNNLGNLFLQTGRFAEAEGSLRLALLHHPDFVEAHCNLGILLQETGQFAEAELSLRHALELNPDYTKALYNLGNLLYQTRRLSEAEIAFRAVPEQSPDFSSAYNNLGNLLNEARRFAESESVLRRALELDPHLAEAHYNLGNLFFETTRLAEAEAAYRRTLELKPDFVKAHGNLGKLFHETNRFSEAEASYRNALAWNSDYAEASYGLSLLLLATGRYAEAWPHHESRYSPNRTSQDVVLPRLPFPQWHGECLTGKSLLLLPEQGFGDQIQFSRYASVLKQRGASRITLVCAPALKSLLETIEGVDAVLTETETIPVHDYWSLLMSVPPHVGTTLETIPNRLPYLHANPERVTAWRLRLPSQHLKVGLVWSGNPRIGDFTANAIDQRRSMHVRQFVPLLQLPGITFVSLQKGGPAHAQLEELPENLRPLDLMADVRDFGDTAAIIQNLDLVITVDTSVAHLAGALNRPVWVLSRFDSCWRWLEEREDSPWYPGAMRLLRQTSPGDWETPVANVRSSLLLRLEQK